MEQSPSEISVTVKNLFRSLPEGYGAATAKFEVFAMRNGRREPLISDAFEGKVSDPEGYTRRYPVSLFPDDVCEVQLLSSDAQSVEIRLS